MSHRCRLGAYCSNVTEQSEHKGYLVGRPQVNSWPLRLTSNKMSNTTTPTQVIGAHMQQGSAAASNGNNTFNWGKVLEVFNIQLQELEQVSSTFVLDLVDPPFHAHGSINPPNVKN